MRLTLLRAKEALARFSPADVLEYRINRVCERYLTDAKFSGTMHRLAIRAPYGQLSLPRGYRTVDGVQVNGFVYQLGNQWYEMMPGKSIYRNHSMDVVRDLGDGHAILYTPRVNTDTPLDATLPANDIPDDGDITVSYTGDPTTVTIYGYDNTGMPVELVFTAAETKANVFARITRIQKPIGTVAVQVSYIADDTDNTVTTLALMEPKEEETFYRRYMIDSIACRQQNAVSALCKRRHIEFTSEQDVLPFSNLGALENGMQAVNFEAANDTGAAETYWGIGLKILNSELKDTNPASSYPVIKMVYPGGTTPKLTSHY